LSPDEIDNRGSARIVAGRFSRSSWGVSWSVWGADVTHEQISEFCIACLAKVLRISKDSVETGTKFNRIGLDSAMVVYFMMDLEEGLGLELSPDDFYDHPTVDALSKYLAERLAQRAA
jgi:acyl carrier protein